MKVLLVFVIMAILLQSCGTMDTDDLSSRRNDFINRFTSKRTLKATLNWKMGDDILILRKNSTFRYYSKVFGLVNSGYYSGTYESENGWIVFKFYKNHKPAFFESDTLRLEKKDNYQILKNKKSNNYLVIN